MSDRKRLVLVIPGWAGLVSAIALQRLLVAPTLISLDLALILAASVLADLVAGELENAVLGFAGILFVSAVLIAVVLTLPVTLGLTGPLWETVAEQDAAIRVFQTFFPFTLVLLLVGGVIGSALAERLELS